MSPINHSFRVGSVQRFVLSSVRLCTVLSAEESYRTSDGPRCREALFQRHRLISSLQPFLGNGRTKKKRCPETCGARSDNEDLRRRACTLVDMSRMSQKGCPPPDHRKSYSLARVHIFSYTNDLRETSLQVYWEGKLYIRIESACESALGIQSPRV